jgi:hypothetical protein
MRKGARFGVGICLVAAGCTAGGGDGSFQFTAVADPSTAVSALTDQQAIDLCVAMVEHYDAQLGADSLVRALCLAGSVSAASTEAECTAAVPTCEAEYRPMVDFAGSCEVAITRVRTECDATVAEVERCIDDTTVVLGGLLGGSCADAATVEEVNGTRYDSSSPPSCLALSAACSELVLQSGRAP